MPRRFFGFGTRHSPEDRPAATEERIEPVVSGLRRQVLDVLSRQLDGTTLDDLEAARRARLVQLQVPVEDAPRSPEVARREEVAALRQSLEAATEPVERHFIFNSLEKCLYKSRKDYNAALSDFEVVCEAHHAETGTIRPALVREFGSLPMIPMYRQMAIMKAKSKDFPGALAWAGRGLAMYGSEAFANEWVTDLENRAATYRDRIEADG